MQSTSRQFSSNARKGIADEKLQAALSKLSHGFPVKRLAAMARLPEFEALRDDAQAIKEHTLANLGTYLETYEAKVLESGGHVHWATDAAEAWGTFTVSGLHGAEGAIQLDPAVVPIWCPVVG